MGTRWKRWRVVILASGAVLVVVLTTAVWRGSLGSGVVSDHDNAAKACDENDVRTHAWPTLRDLKAADPTTIILCRWHASSHFNGDPDAVSSARLVGAHRDRVLRALQHLHQHEPKMSMIDSDPPAFFTLDLQGPGPAWRVRIPRDNRLGTYLSDGAFGAPHASGELPRLLDSWVDR